MSNSEYIPKITSEYGQDSNGQACLKLTGPVRLRQDVKPDGTPSLISIILDENERVFPVRFNPELIRNLPDDVRGTELREGEIIHAQLLAFKDKPREYEVTNFEIPYEYNM